MLVWADKMFNCFGPENDRTCHALPVLEEMMLGDRSGGFEEKLKPEAGPRQCSMQRIEARLTHLYVR